MAILNENEKLIQKAATGEDPFLHSVYKRFYNHFKAENSVFKNKYDDCKFIEYLYVRNHKEKTFEYIALEVLHIALSTLEDRRALYVTIFNYYLTSAQSDDEPKINYNI